MLSIEVHRERKLSRPWKHHQHLCLTLRYHLGQSLTTFAWAELTLFLHNFPFCGYPEPGPSHCRLGDPSGVTGQIDRLSLVHSALVRKLAVFYLCRHCWFITCKLLVW